MTRIISSLSQIATDYDVVFCDLWGVLHNGQEVFPAAVAALRAFRRDGGTVVLMTNAPRPRGSVLAQLDRLEAPRDCYDLVISSGDACQTAVAAGTFGTRVHHIGPARDMPFFDDHDGRPLPVALVPLEEADSLVCTGLVDDQTETPADYAPVIASGIARNLRMLCVNPDIVVDRGDTRIYCGGALGAAYSEAGGTTVYCGKPHPPIYDQARVLVANRRGAPVPDARVLAIGDGVLTDIPGAATAGIDALFVAGGLGAAAIGIRGGAPDPDGLRRYLADTDAAPRYTIGYLA